MKEDNQIDNSLFMWIKRHQPVTLEKCLMAGVSEIDIREDQRFLFNDMTKEVCVKRRNK